MTRPRTSRLFTATAIIAVAALIGGCSSASTGDQSSANDSSQSSGSQTPGGDSSTPAEPGGSSESPDTGDAPVTGGNLTARIQQDPGSLDAVCSANAGTSQISRQIFENLYLIDANFVPQPVLATGYTLSDDGTVYTFALREDVVFSDGTPMTSKDVVASLQDWIPNSSFAAGLNSVLGSIEADGDHTVVVTLTEPYDLIAMIANSTAAQIHKADLVASKPATGIPNDQVIGTGPYKLQSWKPDDEIVLERNDLYRPPPGTASGLAGAQGAYLDTITWKVIGDSDAAFNALSSGQIDVLQGTTDQYDVIKADPALKTGISSGGSVVFIAPNFNEGSIFKSQDARDALNLVLDKQAIMAVQGSPDLVEANNGAFASPQNKPLYSEAGKEKWLQHDPEKAKELFLKAGYQEGQKLRMISTDEFPQFKDALVQLQQDLKAIGIDSEIEMFDFGTLIGRKNDDPNSWDLFALMDDSFPPVPDFSTNVRGLANGGYDTTDLKAAMSEFFAATDDTSRHAAVDGIQEVTAKYLPTVTLYAQNNYIAFADRVQGFDGWGMTFTNAWVQD